MKSNKASFSEGDTKKTGTANGQRGGCTPGEFFKEWRAKKRDNKTQHSETQQHAALDERQLQKRIGRSPSTGEGVHRWIFSAALRLKNHCDEETACLVIERAVADCGREVPEREITESVANAYNSEAKERAPKWPFKNLQLVKEVSANGPSVKQLEQSSPVSVLDLRPEAALDSLFPGDVLICAGETHECARTYAKGVVLRNAKRFQLIVPNPMTATSGLTKAKRVSARCLDNTGARRFLVVESDPKKWDELNKAEQERFGTEERYLSEKKDEAAGIIWHLQSVAEELPLVMVVDSAGKSVHAWFFVEGKSEEILRAFFRYAVALGADPATWSRCQLVRMPGGVRDNGKEQRILYFNPAALEVK